MLQGFVRPLLITLSVAAALVGLSCSQLEFQGLGYDYRQETFMESLPEDSTRDYWLKLYRILAIVNDTLAKQLDYLDIEEDRATIDSLVEGYKRRMDFETRPDTPDRNEWWEEIWNVRAAHCDSLYRAPFVRDWWDKRAEMVIQVGIPENEVLMACGDCSIKLSDSIKSLSHRCQYYYLEWMSRGISIGYVDFNCDDYFDELMSREWSFAAKSEARLDRIPRYLPFAKATKRIEAAVDFASFPDSNDFTLWVNSGVGMSQFVADTANRISFHQKLAISRLGAIVPRLVYNDSTPPMSIPLPDTVRELDELWLPQHLGGYRLPAGEYDIYLTLYDDHAPDHVGAYRTKVTLPSPKASRGMSDILVALEPAGRVFEGTANRIVRGDLTLLGNPSYYLRGDTIYPYVEIDVSDFRRSKLGTYDYTILASLYRSQETFGKPTTEISGVLEVDYDTTDATVARQILRKPRHKGEGMIFSVSRTSRQPRIAFQEPMILPATMPSGKYLLVISAQDASSRKYLTSWREIRVKK